MALQLESDLAIMRLYSDCLREEFKREISFEKWFLSLKPLLTKHEKRRYIRRKLLGLA